MTSAPPSGHNGNGRNGGNGGTWASVSEKLIRALPPAFLLLVIMNIAFLGVAAYVFQHNTEVRNVMITRIIESCLKQQ
jgi:hypothetical protein